MNIKTRLRSLRLKIGADEPTDLESWREWFIKVLIALFIVGAPLAIAASLPTLLTEKRYGLIGLDISIWAILLIQFFAKGGSYRFRFFSGMTLLYIMTLSFFVALGPHHARSGWLVMCAVIAALMFGYRAAAATAIFNAVLLMTLYGVIGPENKAWTAEYAAPFSKWIMFVINISIVTLAAGLPVGFLLDKLDRSLKLERSARKNLLAEDEILKRAFRKLQSESSQRRQAGKNKKRLEIQLQQTQKMEAVGSLAGGIAHNFRNILGGILISCELIQQRYYDHQRLIKTVLGIHNAAKRGSDLVDGLMWLTRKPDIQKHETLDLSRTIQETCDLIGEAFHKKIEIRTRIAKVLPVIGDHFSLGQTILNLATNARDAMPEGGQLSISAEQKEDQIEIVVSDTGHGMDKETQARCFDPFFTTKEAGRGTGIGLSTIFTVIKEHGGHIEVESEPDKGTTFKLFLPKASAE